MEFKVIAEDGSQVYVEWKLPGRENSMFKRLQKRETDRKTDARAFTELRVAFLAATSPSTGLLPGGGQSRVPPEMSRLVNGT